MLVGSISNTATPPHFIHFLNTMFLPYRLLGISLKRIDCWKQYLHYERSLLKRENSKYLVIPKFLNFRIPNNGCFEPTAVHNFQRKLLKEELFKPKKALAEHESKVYKKRNILKSVLPSQSYNHQFYYSQVTLFNTQKKLLKQRTQKKTGKFVERSRASSV